jgi:hypothetical protein
MMPQERFDFPDEPTPAPRPMKPSIKGRGHRESTSICAYCGMRMPSGLLDTTPPANDNRWVIAAPYHAPTCRWVLTKGLRLNEGSHP